MALLESARKAMLFVRDLTTRARYSSETLQLLKPFAENQSVDKEWMSQFEYQLLRGRRESFVEAASRLLAPHQRAHLLFTLADTLGTDDFRPKNPLGNRNIIQDIWVHGQDKDIVLQEIMSMKGESEVREKVLRALK